MVGLGPLLVRPDDLELVTLDPSEIDALDTDQSGLGLAPRRVHIAFVVNVGFAGRQVVGATFHDLARVSVRRLFEKLPIGHLRDARYLAIDRPARTVVVRRTVLRPLVDVGKNAKA